MSSIHPLTPSHAMYMLLGRIAANLPATTDPTQRATLQAAQTVLRHAALAMPEHSEACALLTQVSRMIIPCVPQAAGTDIDSIQQRLTTKPEQISGPWLQQHLRSPLLRMFETETSDLIMKCKQPAMLTTVLGVTSGVYHRLEQLEKPMDWEIWEAVHEQIRNTKFLGFTITKFNELKLTPQNWKAYKANVHDFLCRQGDAAELPVHIWLLCAFHLTTRAIRAAEKAMPYYPIDSPLETTLETLCGLREAWYDNHVNTHRLIERTNSITRETEQSIGITLAGASCIKAAKDYPRSKPRTASYANQHYNFDKMLKQAQQPSRIIEWAMRSVPVASGPGGTVALLLTAMIHAELSNHLEPSPHNTPWVVLWGWAAACYDGGHCLS